MRTTIHVTHDDIEQGCAADSDNCPIAKAITRCMVPGFVARVGTDQCDIWALYEDVQVVELSLPREAQVFIAAFDSNEADLEDLDCGAMDCDPSKLIAPFSFELDLPVETQHEQAEPGRSEL